MRRLDEALSALVEQRRAEGPDHLIGALRRRLGEQAKVVALPVRTDTVTTQSGSRWRGPRVAAGVLATTLLIALPILWLGGGDETTGVGEAPITTTTTAPTTSVAPTTTTPPPTIVLPSHLEPALLQLGDEIGFSQSGDTLWAWDGQGGVAGYRDGEWRAFPSLPDQVADLAGSMDGPIWAVTQRNLWYLEDGDWRSLPEELTLPPYLEIEWHKIEVDRATGVVWVLSGPNLYRWDGVELSLADSSPQQMILDDMVVAGDGTIWGARNNFYHPQDDRLARFDEGTSTWVSVRPLGGTEDLPTSIAVTPAGNLWVGLADPPAPPLDRAELVLAYLDSATGEWTTYRLPGGIGGDMVADDEVVWFHGAESDLIRFDGEIVSVFSPDGWFDNLGLGNDGTFWVTIRYERNGVYRLVTDQETTG